MGRFGPTPSSTPARCHLTRTVIGPPQIATLYCTRARIRRQTSDRSRPAPQAPGTGAGAHLWPGPVSDTSRARPPDRASELALQVFAQGLVTAHSSRGGRHHSTPPADAGDRQPCSPIPICLFEVWETRHDSTPSRPRFLVAAGLPIVPRSAAFCNPAPRIIAPLSRSSRDVGAAPAAPSSLTPCRVPPGTSRNRGRLPPMILRGSLVPIRY